MIALFWRKLPPVARRRFDGRVLPRFGSRLFLFFMTFFVSFGAYVMSFVTGAEWGVAYGKRCLSLCESLMGRLSDLLSKTPVPMAARVGNGLVRLVSNDMAAVIMASFLLAIAVVVAFSLVSVITSVVRMLSGRDGSQAEVYDGSERIDGVSPDAARPREPRADGARTKPEALGRRRSGPWRPDVSGNPYSTRRKA